MKKQLITTLYLLCLSFPTIASHPGGAVYADVNGLVCDFCARALEKVFGKRDDVTGIEVDLNVGKVVINTVAGADIDDATLTQLITDSGYDLVAIDKSCS